MFKRRYNKKASEMPKEPEVQNTYTMPLIVTSGLVFGPEVSTAVVIDNRRLCLPLITLQKIRDSFVFAISPIPRFSSRN
jgi:hypothetical protein